MMEDLFNPERSIYHENSFDGHFLLDDAFSRTLPSTTGYFQTISRPRDQELAYISNDDYIPYQSNQRSRTTFDTGSGYSYAIGSVMTSPSYGESSICSSISDDLELAASSADGTGSPPKDVGFDAWPRQTINKGGRHARAVIEPMKKVRRVRANDRERRRMKSLNRALESLKKCLPVPQSKRRVTKLEVLRIACSYIRSLSDTLNDKTESVTCPYGRKRTGKDLVVNGFSVAQRLQLLSGTGATRI